VAGADREVGEDTAWHLEKSVIKSKTGRFLGFQRST